MVAHLPEAFREDSESLEFIDKEQFIKTLGLTRCPNQDVFSFEEVHLDECLRRGTLTKREMLSDIAKVFDPLGWLSPITVQLTQLMQQSWESNIGWDEKLPDELSDGYLEWREALHHLKHIQLSRFILCPDQLDKAELPVFCDASEKAYAAAIDVVSQGTHGGRKSSLLTAKCKISPLKPVKIPRLELCATLPGTHLLNSVKAALAKMEVNIGDCHAWSDSTTCLSSQVFSQLSWPREWPKSKSVTARNVIMYPVKTTQLMWHREASIQTCYVGSLQGGRDFPGYPKETSQHHPSIQRRQKS